MNGDPFVQQSTQSTLDWRSALQTCFRQKVTLAFETGKQNRMIISKAAIRALNNPTYVQLLMSMDELTLLLLGTEYRYPDSLRVSETEIDPLSQYRQMDLARLMEKAGWRKGYRYTLSAISLDVGGKPALVFQLMNAEISLKIPRLSVSA